MRSVSRFRRKKSPLIPDPGQKVRLRTKSRLLGGSFRAISGPITADTGEVVIWITEEEEYEASRREGRPAAGRPWPAKRMEVIFSEEEADEAGHELPEASQSVGEEQGTTELPLPREDSRKRWWRRAFGGWTSEVVELTSTEAESLCRPLEEFERYTQTKSPGA